MNKKLFALVLISAAFFFGCSADSSFTSGIPTPAWDGEPSTTGHPGQGPGPGPGGGPQYCAYKWYGILDSCEEIDESFTKEDCDSNNGKIVSSCD